MVEELSRLYLITDRNLRDNCFVEHLYNCVQSGVNMIQLREKDLSTRDYISLAEEVLEKINKPSFKLIINGRPDIALAIKAHGVQLGNSTLPIDVVRNFAGGDDLIIGYSTHSLEEAYRAQIMGADFVTFSPIFETPSKKQYGAPQGLNKLKIVCDSLDIPVYGLGGISLSNTKEIFDAGAYGIAFIRLLMESNDPERIVRHLSKHIIF